MSVDFNCKNYIKFTLLSLLELSKILFTKPNDFEMKSDKLKHVLSSITPLSFVGPDLR